MKNLLYFLFLSFTSSIFGQCPTAGSDTLVERLINEPFDLIQFIAFNADSGGYFTDPSNNLVSTTNQSLSFQGIFPFQYIVAANGCVNDSSVISVRINNAWFGLNENIIEENALASPNPFEDVLIIDDSNFDNLQVFNSLGQLVFECEVLFSKEIDLSNFQQGIYLLRIERENKVFYQRILKE